LEPVAHDGSNLVGMTDHERVLVEFVAQYTLCFRHALADVVIERRRTPIVGFAEVHVQSFRVVFQRLQSHKIA